MRVTGECSRQTRGKPIEWGDLFGALIVAAIWVAILVSLSNGLGETRRAYIFGVGSAASAYIVAMVAAVVLALAIPAAPGWVNFVVLAPIIEESARLVGADTAYRRSTWRHWAVFGVGYALLETGLKLTDGLVIAITSGLDQWFRLLVPIVPFLLHVFLSMFMCLLLQRGASLVLACLISMGLHALHNWSAAAFAPDTVPNFLLMVVARSALFLALIYAIVQLSKRPLAAPAQAT